MHAKICHPTATIKGGRDRQANFHLGGARRYASRLRWLFSRIFLLYEYCDSWAEVAPISPAWQDLVELNLSPYFKVVAFYSRLPLVDA